MFNNFVFFFLGNIINRAREDSLESAQKEVSVSTQGAQSEAANALSCLAEIYNDYDSFHPQNLMVKYISPGVNRRPVKKTPFSPSAPEWAELANEAHDIEPTNLLRRGILRDEAWIKSTWNDCYRWLHQTFVQYNRSGQHDAEMGEWCSPKELERWVRATKYKTAGSNTIICYPTAMVYSICLLDQYYFEGIGRQMPKGIGVDCSMADGTKARKRKRGKNKKKSEVDRSNNSLLLALNNGTKAESKMAALHLLLEFGCASQKAKTMKEVERVASSANEEEKSGEEEGQSSESQSIDSNDKDSDSESV